MSTLKNPAKDLAKSRHQQLVDAENKIHAASRDTVESIRIIGQELTRIEKDELYEVMGRNDFQEYVEFSLKFDYQLARAWMRASAVLDLLDQQKLQLPYNQSQVLELMKLKTPEVQATVWQKILDFCDREKKIITVQLVRDTVTAARTKANQLVTRARFRKPKPARGIDIDLGDAGNGQTAAPPRKVWSEEGEKALNRIRRLCGDPIGDALDQGNPEISERDLIQWSKEEPEMVKNLAYYIVHKRWTLRKAIAYEAEAVDMESTVEQLVDLARSRGGSAYVEFQDVKISIEIVT